jgi:glycosyltransferase involved in cell wall biosynthesis
MGTRGIPANYGGFETFAQECATGLAARGHTVTVYGRTHYVPKTLRSFKDVRIVVLPTLKWKYTDTVVHTFLSVLHGVTQHYDAVLICNAANSVFAWIPRVFGAAVVVNVDGLEHLRSKWSRLGKRYYRLSEFLSTKFPNAIVTDARVIERYYLERHHTRSFFIPYGAARERPESREALDALGLAPQSYFLYVSRFEPENNLHRVVAAFEKVRTSKRLVAVGDAPYAADYIRAVRRTRDSRISFPGAIYGRGYWQLLANAYCYIHATEVGGTHPALVEAMAQGRIIIANHTSENAEVLGETGILYRKNDVDELARCIQEVADHPETYAGLAPAAQDRASALYSWESVVDQYEQLLKNLTGNR